MWRTKRWLETENVFIQGKSYVTILTAFSDTMTEFMEEGRVVDVIYLNFEKVFDTVSYNILV